LAQAENDGGVEVDAQMGTVNLVRVHRAILVDEEIGGYAAIAQERGMAVEIPINELLEDIDCVPTAIPQLDSRESSSMQETFTILSAEGMLGLTSIGNVSRDTPPRKYRLRRRELVVRQNSLNLFFGGCRPTWACHSPAAQLIATTRTTGTRRRCTPAIEVVRSSLTFRELVVVAVISTASRRLGMAGSGL
jgi:hypothetical protein